MRQAVYRSTIYHQTIYRWKHCLFLLTLPLWLGGCLTTLGARGVANPSSTYRYPGAEYERTDDLPTPHLFDFQLQLPDSSGEP